MIAYMVRHKLTGFWLLNKVKRNGGGKGRDNTEFWTNNAKNASIWLRRTIAIKTVRTNKINKESEIVEFELKEL